MLSGISSYYALHLLYYASIMLQLGVVARAFHYAPICTLEVEHSIGVFYSVLILSALP